MNGGRALAARSAALAGSRPLWRRPAFACALALALFAAGAGLLPATLPWAARATIAISLAMAAIWATEPLPLQQTSLLVFAALTLVAGLPASAAFSGLSSSSTGLLLFGFMMAAGVNATPLGRRAALWILGRVGATPGRAVWGIFLAMHATAFFMPGYAVRTALLLPIVRSLVEGAESSGPPLPNLRRLLGVGLAFAGAITGLGILPAAVANPLVAELIGAYRGRPFGYFEWWLAGYPLAWAMTLAGWWVLMRVFPPEVEEFPGGRQRLLDELRALGPMSAAEWRCLGILVLTVGLWMTEGWHGLSTAVPALLAAALMALPGVGCANWPAMLRISWETTLFFAASVSLGTALSSTGAANSLAGALFLGDAGYRLLVTPVVSTLFVALLVQVYHLAVPLVASLVAVLVPVVLAAARAAGADGETLALSAGMSSVMGFLLVVQTLTNVIAYGSGYFTGRDLLRAGWPLTVIGVGLIALSAAFWWPALGIGR